MNTSNVRWPESLWAAMTPSGPELPQLTGTQQADVIVIGGGFTGLSTALHLREAGVDVVAPCHIEEIRSTVAQHADKTFSRLAVLRNNVLRIGPRQRRDHLAIIAPRRAPARLGCLDNRDIDTRFAQMQRGGQAGKTATDHDHIRLLRA